jgi:hypothetical protein
LKQGTNILKIWLLGRTLRTFVYPLPNDANTMTALTSAMKIRVKIHYLLVKKKRGQQMRKKRKMYYKVLPIPRS